MTYEEMLNQRGLSKPKKPSYSFKLKGKGNFQKDWYKRKLASI
jgi:hypothetical protein